MDSDTEAGDTDRVETLVGTQVYTTAKRVKNPVTEEYERIDRLSENGYKRRFLAVLSESSKPSIIDLSQSPVATFDKDKWKLEEREDRYLLVKRSADVDTNHSGDADE